MTEQQPGSEPRFEDHRVENAAGANAHDQLADSGHEELVRALSDEVRLLRERLELAPSRLNQAQTELADQRRRSANLAASND
jgi:hypothetical protein